MSDTLPDGRTVPPEYPDPDESDLERRDLERRDLEQQHQAEREELPAPDATSPDEEPESVGAVPGSNADTETPAQTAPVAEREAAPETGPMAEREAAPEAAAAFVPEAGPVFAPESAQSFRVRWSSIQAGFIDDPRHAVEDADRFVADVVQSFTSGVEARRRTLTSAWEQDGHGGTEELRLTMRQYRALVDRILLG